MTVIQSGVWTGVVDAVAVAVGTVDVAVVTTEVGEFDTGLDADCVTDGEHAVSAAAKAIARSMGVLTRPVYPAPYEVTSLGARLRCVPLGRPNTPVLMAAIWEYRDDEWRHWGATQGRCRRLSASWRLPHGDSANWRCQVMCSSGRILPMSLLRTRTEVPESRPSRRRLGHEPL